MVDCCWRRYGHRHLGGSSATDAQPTVWHATVGPAYVGYCCPGARRLLIGSQLLSGASCGDGQSGRSASCRLAWSVLIFDAGREFAQNKFLKDAVGYIGAEVNSKRTEHQSHAAIRLRVIRIRNGARG